jgi:hypothetical protein
MLGSTSTECVIAQVTGEAYRALMAWRDEADLQVLRAQIAHRGKARVVRLGTEHVFTDITELPRPGEAEPFYGTFGGGYEYWFLHGPVGWMLRVENKSRPTVRFGPIEPIPPILLDDSTAVRVDVRRTLPEGVSWAGPGGLVDHRNTEDIGMGIFSIDGEMYDLLHASSWTPARLTQYKYLFIPLSVGCEIVVEDAVSGAQVHLTKDAGW